MNQNTTRFIINVSPDGHGGYNWSVHLAPAAGYGAKRSASGHEEKRKSAISAAIREAGALSKVGATEGDAA